MKSSSLWLALAVLLAPLAQASELESLWHTVQTQNPGLQAQASAVAARAAEAQSERWRYGPTVTLNSRYTQLNDELSLTVDLSALNPLAPPMHETIQQDQYSTATLEAKLPVFTGGRIKAAVAAADARLDDQQAQADQQRQAVLLQLVDRYYSVILAREAVDIRQRRLDTLDRQVYSAQRREQEGLIAAADRLSVEVERDEARRALSNAQADLELATLVYRQLVGTAVPLPQPGPLAPLSADPDLDQLAASLLTDSPEMDRLNAQADLAAAGALANRASWLPTVAVFGRYELLQDDLTALEPQWAAGLAMEWALLDGGNRYRQRQAALARVDQAQQQRQQSETDLNSRLQQDVRDLRRAEANIKALASTEALVAEKVALTQRGYDQGLSTDLDRIEAETALAAVRMQRLQAVVEQHQALARLYIRAGDANGFFALLDRNDA
ncbi:TolC family protein [Saccharospirillum mangrovi]|uniref:TolC family protein n=1 Tax=Saccharospirillum mangrovi TaxID=2161747 RepID=UPI000D38A7BC|nr:TolC family protein [Saccharospirillum mangrovi]